jgi:hypothetical protein
MNDDTELEPADEGLEQPEDLEGAQPTDEASAKAALVQALGARLKDDYERRKGQRLQIEQRWLSDLEQYNSVYSKDTLDHFKQRKYGSQVFVPLTRRICNIVEARLGDLLFPTDDRNFVVESSPIPDLSDADQVLGQLPPDAPIVINGQQAQVSDLHQAVRELKDEADKKAANMQRAVDDQLTEANYPTEARKAIHDAIKLGTGVLKGPFALARRKKSWSIVNGVAQIVVKDDVTATVKRVDPWNIYPELGVSEAEECRSWFELHRMSETDLAELAKQPGFSPEAIAKVLTAGTLAMRDFNLDQQREAAGTVGVDDDRFNLIEYTGPVKLEELRAAGVKVPEDPLMFYNAVVWFSEFTGDVVKAILYPMDGCDAPYRVFNWQKDSACIFGYGLPYEIRDLQESANSAYRAAMDNLGLTVGPQIVINSKKIRPVNGQMTIEPNKLWDLQDASQQVDHVFGFYQIDSKVQELLTVFQAAKSVAEEIGGPVMAMQGTEAPSYVQAGATGMSIAYNAANIWMRRAVKNWDDQVTVPMVSDFIDWNMQYNPDPDIKGDLHAIARGTSALLEAEGQVQRIELLAKLSAEAGIPLRNKIAQLRQAALAMRLDPDELLPNDDEVKQLEQQQQQQQPQDISGQRLQLQKAMLDDKQVQRQFEERMEQQRTNLALAEIASRERISMNEAREKYGFQLQQTQAELADRQQQRAHEAQQTNAELAVKVQMGSGI